LGGHRAAEVVVLPPAAWVLAPFDPDCLERLVALGPVAYESWTRTERLWDPEGMAERLAADGFAALFVEGDFVFEEALAATALRFVGVCRGNPRNVDLEAATHAGVVVAYTPGRNAIAVAEFTVGLILAGTRGIVRAHNRVNAGAWTDPISAYFGAQTRELSGRILGLLGLGTIAREVARRLAAFDMCVLAYDPYLPPDAAPLGVTLVSLDTLAAQSDVLSIHCPASEETEGLVGVDFLARMKPEAYLVNTAAPAVIDTEALAEALRSGRLAGAALDVHKVEPLPPNHPLLGLENALLTPHIGGATVDVVRHHSEQILADYVRFLAGERPVRLANPEVWDRRR
jgi:phosphoglycerate dehydrogenase-like enzyme